MERRSISLKTTFDIGVVPNPLLFEDKLILNFIERNAIYLIKSKIRK